jgi:hypothetical protein
MTNAMGNPLTPNPDRLNAPVLAVRLLVPMAASV